VKPRLPLLLENNKKSINPSPVKQDFKKKIICFVFKSKIIVKQDLTA